MSSKIDQISDTQLNISGLDDGPVILLSEPGAEKTTILATRLCSILNDYSEKKFRLLALTYTNKAGHDLRRRVEAIVPNNNRRLFFGTFHSFSASILRQHGSHIGMKPDFAIFDQMEDRIELLQEAVNGEYGRGFFNQQDVLQLLLTIDQLRRQVIGYENVKSQFCDRNYGETVANIYRIYEGALSECNASDFNGLILNSCRLLEEVPMVAAHYRIVYKYWFIDEFQDTTVAQYKFLRLLAGEEFKNIFVVVDDDQSIFQWAGASFDHIKDFKKKFKPTIVQLNENRRCPSQIVDMANRLIRHNSERISEKRGSVASAEMKSGVVDLRIYANELQEASETAKSILEYVRVDKHGLAVLGRTQAILRTVLEQLIQHQVRASMATTRDNFVSPHFNWLLNCLQLAHKPNDRRAFISLTNSANLVTGTAFDPEIIIAEPLSTGLSYLEHWVNVVNKTNNSKAKELASLAFQLVQSRASWRKVVDSSIETIVKINDDTMEEQSDDIVEDREAWRNIHASIRSASSEKLELHEFLHGMKLHSKEPPSSLSEVRLYTIHSAKGLEFDHVWMIGMADTILPSWHSLKEGAKPQLLEEERRACFVGMTRAKKSLTFSYAQNYNGYPKERSRFLPEMGFL